MKKYCYLTRIDGKFKAVDTTLCDNLEIGATFYDEAISIGFIEGKDLLEIEQKAKDIMRKRFNEYFK